MNKLHLGSGNQPKKGWINLDILPGKNVDVVHDLNYFPYPFKDNSIDEIYTEYVLEHMKDIIGTLKEIYRICKNKAIIEIIVPHFTAHRMFGDLTHHRFFSYTSFDNFITNPSKYDGSYRNVNYAPDIKFKMISKRICFYQKGKKKGRNTKFMAVFDEIFNYKFMPLLYERFFCFIIPATQLHFKLKVIKVINLPREFHQPLGCG